jgi:hypothetical protein
LDGEQLDAMLGAAITAEKGGGRPVGAARKGRMGGYGVRRDALYEGASQRG